MIKHTKQDLMQLTFAFQGYDECVAIPTTYADEIKSIMGSEEDGLFEFLDWAGSTWVIRKKSIVSIVTLGDIDNKILFQKHEDYLKKIQD